MLLITNYIPFPRKGFERVAEWFIFFYCPRRMGWWRISFRIINKKEKKLSKIDAENVFCSSVKYKFRSLLYCLSIFAVYSFSSIK